MILKPKGGKEFQNDWQSITFATINHMSFPRVAKPYKTNGKLHF